MAERRAMMRVLAAVWPDYELRWAYDGTAELAACVGAKLPPCAWDKQPTLRIASDRNTLCHLVSVVDATGQLRMWPLWWNLSQAWHGPAVLDKLPGRGVGKLALGKIPEGGLHIDVQQNTVGAWQTADSMGIFRELPGLWSGWQTECWEDRFEEQALRCKGALRLPHLDIAAGVDSAQAWIQKRVFQSFGDGPAGQIHKLVTLLAPLGPGLIVSDDALVDCTVRPRKAEWARFAAACTALRTGRAA